MRLVADSLSVSRGGEPVIEAVSFDVAAGEALVVTGPNGVGKSTLLRAIAGLIGPDGGSVRLEGGPEGAEALFEACHYLGHRNAMKRELSVKENLAFWAGFMSGAPVPAGPALGAGEAAAAVGLEATLHLPFGYLSAGQQRRIAMARLLTAWRPVWLLDEPTAALDAGAEALFSGLANRHLEQGGIVVVATHQPLDLPRRRALDLSARSHEGMAA